MQGTLFWGPYNKNPITIEGFRLFRKFPFSCLGFMATV